MDFKDGAVLGKKNIEALEAINFDLNRLDVAEALHDKLSNLLSESTMSPKELEELKTNVRRNCK
ncbi:unnamed protein product [marine sediment metagenome]|uniref:Uncharacterized protein n=1 Tax=marine sediment metagenome TaxID=412755 RepID=X0WAL2_9ZZZZ